MVAAVAVAPLLAGCHSLTRLGTSHTPHDAENIVTEFNLMLYPCIMGAFIWELFASHAAFLPALILFVVRFSFLTVLTARCVSSG